MTEKESNKQSESEELFCVWEIDTTHEGSVDEIMMFRGQLKVPCCERHLTYHKYIMLMVANGYEIEEVLDLDPEEIKRSALVLMMSGLDLSEIEL